MRALAAAAAFLALAAGTAAAQGTGTGTTPPTGTAAEHYERGRRLYDVKEYAAAIEEFKAAYLIDADPIYLFNLAQAYRLSGDCKSAESYFAKFLKADPATTQRAKIEKLIAECTPAPTGDTPPTGTTDTPPTGTTDTPPTGTTDTSIVVAPTAPPADPGRSRRIIGLITAGVGVAALGIGTGLAIHVGGVESDLETECVAGCDWDDIRDRDSSARTKATLSTVMIVGGGVAVLGGAALYFWGRAMRTETPTYTIVPTADGAIATAAFDW
jgi:tetratricopeptide (TPR) repeat protein